MFINRLIISFFAVYNLLAGQLLWADEHNSQKTFHNQSEQTAPALTPEQQIKTLQQFYEKSLVGLDKVYLILPADWLAGEVDLTTDLQSYEQQLQLLSAQTQSLDNSATEEHRNSKLAIQLLELKLQWLHFSNDQRQIIINEASDKALVKDVEATADKEIEAALSAQAELQQKSIELKNDLDQASEAREKSVLSVRLQIEKALAKIAKKRLNLGRGQKTFGESVKNWKQFSANLHAALEDEAFIAGSQDFLSFRERIRELISQSNQVVWSEQAFLKHYFSTSSLDINLESIASLQVRENESESLKDAISDIQKKRISLQVSLDDYRGDKAKVLDNILTWQERSRGEMIALRGQLIQQVIDASAFALNNPEPVLVEFETIVSSIKFFLWRDVFVRNNVDILNKKQFRFNTFLHWLRLLILFAVIIWLFVKRKIILSKTKRWLLSKADSGRVKSWIKLFSDLFVDLYIFSILLLFGKIIIDFIVSIGIEEAQYLNPILNQVVIFFLLVGLINFITPLVSQRSQLINIESNEVRSIELVFSTVPKIYLYYWLVAGILSATLWQFLNVNLIQFYAVNIVASIFIAWLFVSIATHRNEWRLINEAASTSDVWHNLGEKAKGKLWEPLLLLCGGGIGVYRVAWSIISERLNQLEMARSFQAMFSRALLERQFRKSAAKLNSTRFPEKYWNSFNFLSPADKNWYIGRDQCEATLVESYNDWKDNGSTTRVMIEGDRGTGKSELILDFLRKQNISVLHAHIHSGDTTIERVCERLNYFIFAENAPIDHEELLSKIIDLPPQIIIVENLENCILRTIGGFNTLLYVIDLMLRTTPKHMWIVTFTSFAWSIAKQGVSGATCFTDTIQLAGMTEEQLKTLILRRHYDANKTDPDFSKLHIAQNDRKRKSKESEENIQQKGKNLYFRILWDYTRGNPRQALYYWKSSLSIENDRIVVSLFEVPEYRVLENLQDSTLMLLAALIEHNGLTIEGLMSVMNLPELSVRRRIEELSPYGIIFLFESGEKPGWHVESFWARAVENYLEKRQFLFRKEFV